MTRPIRSRMAIALPIAALALEWALSPRALAIDPRCLASALQGTTESVRTRVLGAQVPGVPEPIQPASAPPRPADPRIVDTSTANRYAVSDAANAELRVSGLLDNDGIVRLDIQTVLEDGTRSAVLRGRDQFDRVMRHFRGRTRGVAGFWVYGDNLAEFNRLTRPPHNLSLEEAARRTWTGQQAARHGFTNVRVNVDETRSRRSLVPPFRRIYQQVSVTFTRP